MHIVKILRIRRLRARRLNEVSKDACLVAPLGASRPGLAALEAEPRLETPRFAEPDIVEVETELQLRAPDAVDLEVSPQSVKVRDKGMPTMLGLAENAATV